MPLALRLPLPPHTSSLSPNAWDSRPALRLRLTSARRPSDPRTCCSAAGAGVQSLVVLRCPAPCQRRQLLPAAQALHIPPRERGPATVALLRPVLINGLANLVREAANLPMLYLDTWAAGLGSEEQSPASHLLLHPPEMLQSGGTASSCLPALVSPHRDGTALPSSSSRCHDASRDQPSTAGQTLGTGPRAAGTTTGSQPPPCPAAILHGPSPFSTHPPPPPPPGNVCGRRKTGADT